jgi:hypothetical protein
MDMPLIEDGLAEFSFEFTISDDILIFDPDFPFLTRKSKSKKTI